MELGMWREAEPYFKDILRFGADPDTVAMSMAYLGKIEGNRRRSRESDEWYDRAVRVPGVSPGIVGKISALRKR